VDAVAARLELARGLGAEPLRLGHDDVIERVRDGSEGRGADAVLEAVGASDAGRLAYDVLRSGGVISSVGVCTDEKMSFSPTEAYNKNITFKTGRCPARSLMPGLIEIIRSNHALSSILTHRMPLKDGSEGYKIFDRKEDNCLKVLLTC